MGKIEIELELKSIVDKVNSVADGLKDTRTVNFIDVEGNGIKLSIAADRNEHPMKDWDKKMLLDTGVSLLSLTLPKAKQTTIDNYKAKRGRPPKAKQEKIDLDEEIEA